MSSFQCNYCGRDRYVAVIRGMRDWEYGVEGEYNYFQCLGCEGVQLQPFPGLKDLKKAYDIHYHGYAVGAKRGRWFSLLYAAKEGLFRRQIGRLVTAESRVLDLGCGAGDFLVSLQVLGLRHLEGIDFSHDMIDALRGRGIRGYCGAFTDFDGMPESYDLISMNNYLEHTLEPRQELEKSFSLLRPGAWLVGELPGFDSYERRIFGRYWGGNHVPRHTYQFNSDFLRRLLRDCGFEQVRIAYQLNTSHWALSLQNFMQRRVRDLRHNPALNNGRSKYYLLLLLAFLPVNIICVLMKKSGCLKFYARKPAP